MSYASDDDLVVAEDGIRVEKGFESEDFPVPAMRFAITSERDEPVTVRLSDDIPEEFSMDGVGFHPDYEGENWTAYQDHRVEYERSLQPGEKVVTVYGIRASTMEEVQAFLIEPTIEEIEPAGSHVTGDSNQAVDDQTIQDIAPKETNEVVRDVLSGDRDTLPGMDRDRQSAEATGDGRTEPSSADVEIGDNPPEPSDAEDDDFSDLGLGDDDAEDLLGDIDVDDASDADTDVEEPEPDDDDPVDLGLGDEDEGMALNVDGETESDDSDDGLALEDIPETDELDDDEDPSDVIADPDAEEPHSGEASDAPDSPGSPESTSETEGVDDTGTAAGPGERSSPTADDSDPVDIDFEAESDDQAVAIDPEPPGGSAESASEETEASEPSDPGDGLDLEPDLEPGATTGEESAATEPEVESELDDGASVATDGPETTTDPSLDGDSLSESADSDQSTGVASGTVPDTGTESIAGDSTDDDTSEPAEVADGTVVAALLEEIESGAVHGSELDKLRSALVDDSSDASRSVETRLRRVESRMEEFDAYTDALREFIDEQGTADEIIDSLEAEMAELRAEVDGLSESVDDNSDAAESVSEAVDVLESDLASVTTDVSSLSGRVDDVSADVAALEDGLDTAESAIEDVQSRVSDVAGDVAAAEEKLGAELESLQSDLQAVREDVQDIVEWRGQLGEMFK